MNSIRTRPESSTQVLTVPMMIVSGAFGSSPIHLARSASSIVASSSV